MPALLSDDCDAAAVLAVGRAQLNALRAITPGVLLFPRSAKCSSSESLTRYFIPLDPQRVRHPLNAGREKPLP